MGKTVDKIAAPVFEASQFKATEYDRAQDKARFLNKLCKWIAGGMPKEEFLRADKPLYYHLKGHMGHIAHYDRYGFWDEWFASPKDRMRFLNTHGSQTFWGNWTDVHEALKDWLHTSGILKVYADEYYAEKERATIHTAEACLQRLSPPVRDAVALQFGYVRKED